MRSEKGWPHALTLADNNSRPRPARPHAAACFLRLPADPRPSVVRRPAGGLPAACRGGGSDGRRGPPRAGRVDAARGVLRRCRPAWRTARTRPEINQKDVRIRWNNRLFREGTLPLVLPALAGFVERCGVGLAGDAGDLGPSPTFRACSTTGGQRCAPAGSGSAGSRRVASTTSRPRLSAVPSWSRTSPRTNCCTSSPASPRCARRRCSSRQRLLRPDDAVADWPAKRRVSGLAASRRAPRCGTRNGCGGSSASCGLAGRRRTPRR